MKTTIQSILVAAVLATASASGIAAAAGNGATSVTEMLQRKQAHQLRARLVAEGRREEVWQLDENNAAHLREAQKNRVTKTNEALGRASNASKGRGPDDVPLLNECAPEKLRL